MITKICLELEETNGTPIISADAYCLYGWLMERVSSEFAAYLHEGGERPFSQHLIREREEPFRADYHWNLFSEEAVEGIVPALFSTQTFFLHSGEKRLVVIKAEKEVVNFEKIIKRCFSSPQIPTSYKVSFLTPTTFKTEEHYALYPTAELIVKSAAARFAQLDTDVVMKDEEAIAQLAAATQISAYSLRTGKYRMKGSCIQGFTGWVRLTIHGPDPMRRLFWLLMNATPFTGLGIKSALGMGGCGVEEAFSKMETPLFDVCKANSKYK